MRGSNNNYSSIGGALPGKEGKVEEEAEDNGEEGGEKDREMDHEVDAGVL